MSRPSTCPQCNTKPPSSSRSIYCSDECRKAAWNPPKSHDVVCIVCEKIFAAVSRANVCSAECRREKSRRANRSHRRKSRKDITKECVICGQAFVAHADTTVRCEQCRISGTRTPKERDRALEKTRSDRDTLSDAYCKSRLVKRGLPVNEETVEYQRVELLLKRELRKYDEIRPYKYPPLTKTCDVCQVAFVTTSRTKLRCSKECQQEASRRKANALHVTVDRGYVQCGVCGKSFKHPQKGRPKLYCSVHCRQQMRNSRYEERYRKPLKVSACETCGKIFNPWGRQRFCSEYCNPKVKS